jgi:hypothetical protein
MDSISSNLINKTELKHEYLEEEGGVYIILMVAADGMVATTQ